MVKEKKNPKVFIGTTEVAGYFVNLFLGFKKLGVDAGYLNINYIKFKYQGHRDNNYPILNWFQSFAIYTAGLKGAKRAVIKPIYFLCKVFVFIWAAFKFDVFIFGVGSSFLRYKDYKILRFLGKKIIHVSLGSDSRPQYVNGVYKDDNNGKYDLAKMQMINREINALITIIEEYVDVIINYPQHAHFHKRDFISGMYIGFPTRIELGLAAKSIQNRSVRILHAPTRPLTKGSVEFKKIITELMDEGLDIDYVEITNKTNQEVLDEIAQSDIILDELYSDLPLGGLGSEAAIFSKAVVVGGYYADRLFEYDLSEVPPSHYVLPSQVKDVVRRLVTDQNYRIESGEKLNEFIRNHWSTDAVAARYLKLIDGTYPPKWLQSINKLSYLHGLGLSDAELKNLISDLVDHYGFDALGINHNPQLLQRYKELIKDHHHA
jgi:hypothetical protein